MTQAFDYYRPNSDRLSETMEPMNLTPIFGEKNLDNKSSTSTSPDRNSESDPLQDIDWKDIFSDNKCNSKNALYSDDSLIGVSPGSQSDTADLFISALFEGEEVAEDDVGKKNANPKELPQDKPTAPPETPTKPIPQDKPQIEPKQAGDTAAVLSQLNPKFKNDTTEQVQAKLYANFTKMMQAGGLESPEAKAVIPELREAHEELIKRADLTLDAKAFDDAMKTIPVLLRSLKEGKDLTSSGDGKVVASEVPLDTKRRWDFHMAVCGDLDIINKQIELRHSYAQVLTLLGQHKDAEKVLIEARDIAEKLVKPIEIDGKQITPMDLVKQEAEQLLADSNEFRDPGKRDAMRVARLLLLGSDRNPGLLRTPIDTNKRLAEFYLAPEIKPKLDSSGVIVGIEDIKFGKSDAFKPQKAYEAAARAKGHINAIYPDGGKKADQNEHVQVLFGSIAEILDNPKKFDLYRVDEKGAPLFISEVDADNLRKMIRKTEESASNLIDIGIFAVGTGLIMLSRSPKVMSRFERTAGTVAAESTSKSILKTAGLTAAVVGGGTLARNVAFEQLTGTQEGLLKSAEHSVGSLALSVVTFRLSNKAATLSTFKAVGNAETKIHRAASAGIAGVGLAAGVSGTDLQNRQYRMQELLKKAQDPIENKK